MLVLLLPTLLEAGGTTSETTSLLSEVPTRADASCFGAGAGHMRWPQGCRLEGCLSRRNSVLLRQ